MFTVKQLSKMAGITPRTLHYYDEVNLLKPTTIGGNGYRYYDQNALLRLQQILLYREMDMPLEQIKAIMEREDFHVVDALVKHRIELKKQIERLQRLEATVDNTILHLKGKKEMSEPQFFTGFTDKQQEEYENEAMLKFDPEIVKDSNARWKRYSTEEKQRIGNEGNAIYADFVKAIPQGPSSPEAQDCVERWRSHMNYFWTPDLQQLLEIANGYVSDPRFKTNFDKIHPNLGMFIQEAVTVYAAKKNR